MGLSVGDRILLWMILPVVAGVAVVLAPELLGVALAVGEDVAAKHREEAASS